MCGMWSSSASCSGGQEARTKACGRTVEPGDEQPDLRETPRMRNQYFGDRHDFLKYALLRSLADPLELRLLVCWMLVPDDVGRSDKEPSYLSKPHRWRPLDPPLFDLLRDAINNGRRSISVIERSELIPSAAFYSEPLPPDTALRARYFDECFARADGRKLLFFDPDTGLSPSDRSARTASQVYLSWSELERAAKTGATLLLSQFLPRKPRDGFLESLARQVAEATSRSSMFAVVSGHVAFVASVPREHNRLVGHRLRGFAERWRDVRLLEYGQDARGYRRETAAPSIDLSVEARRYFRDELRAARAAALEDAEGFQPIVYAIEQLGSRLTGDAHSLGRYEHALTALADTSPLSAEVPGRHSSWHSTFDALYRLVRTGRNDALHQGAYARNLAQHAVELAIVLEDALMGEADRVRDFMVSDPVCAQPFQPISALRQTMLSRSFSYVPFRASHSDEWKLISDLAVARYLRGDKSERTKRLATTVGKAAQSGELVLEKALTCDANASVEAVLQGHRAGQSDTESRSRITLVLDPNSAHLVGLITPFDLM